MTATLKTRTRPAKWTGILLVGGDRDCEVTQAYGQRRLEGMELMVPTSKGERSFYRLHHITGDQWEGIFIR